MNLLPNRFELNEEQQWRTMRIHITLLFFIFCILSLFSTSTADNKYEVESIENYSFKQENIDVLSQHTLISKEKDKYSVKNLFDNDLSTCWATKFVNNIDYDSNDGLLRIKFKNPKYLKSIILYNGYQKSRKLFYNNHRIKEIYIEKVIVGGRNFPLSHVFRVKDIYGK